MKDIRELDIAVVGMAVKFPKADNVSDFWNGLVNGEDFITRTKKYGYSAEESMHSELFLIRLILTIFSLIWVIVSRNLLLRRKGYCCKLHIMLWKMQGSDLMSAPEQLV